MVLRNEHIPGRQAKQSHERVSRHSDTKKANDGLLHSGTLAFVPQMLTEQLPCISADARDGVVRCRQALALRLVAEGTQRETVLAKASLLRSRNMPFLNTQRSMISHALGLPGCPRVVPCNFDPTGKASFASAPYQCSSCLQGVQVCPTNERHVNH